MEAQPSVLAAWCGAQPAPQPGPDSADFLTAAQLARRLGVSREAVRRLRSGWVRASRRDRDRAVLAAVAAGYTAEAIGTASDLSISNSHAAPEAPAENPKGYGRPAGDR
jgi:hypothetical protein